MEITTPKYFLGANSCEGFVSHFSTFYKNDDSWRIYILKGGPGTGKSSFMKFIAAKCFDFGLGVELCPCSSDPHSLDGLIIPKIKTAVLDGTAPHVLEPELPGVVEEIINLGAFWDGEKLKENAKGIEKEWSENKILHKAARGYLYAAGELLRDNLKISLRLCDKEKVEKYALNMAKKLILKRNMAPSEDIRFIGGITPEGVVGYGRTITDYCRNTVILEDKYGGAAAIFMAKIREYALTSGYHILTLKNPFLPSLMIDHIVIPELSLAFCREYEYMHFLKEQRRIHSSRFYDLEIKKQMRGRMLFNRKMSKDLLGIAANMLSSAKTSHDRLEKYYVEAMNFDLQVSFANDIAEKILKIF